MHTSVKTPEFARWCERPDVGYLDNFMPPGALAIIIGAAPHTDIVVNSIIYTFVQQNYNRYRDIGLDIEVAHEHAQPIVDLEFGEGQFDYFRPDLLFISLDPKGGEVTPKGIGMAVGKVVLYRKAKGKPVYLISPIGTHPLIKHYDIPGVAFADQLRQMPTIMAVDHTKVA